MELKPCKECPYRKDSAPGWLGEASYDPVEFLKQLDLVFAHPCHKTVDWESNDTLAVLDAPPCQGMLQFAKNACKMLQYRPYEDIRKKLKVNDSVVFATRQDFIDHHKEQ